MRGEKYLSATPELLPKGSPPHARGKGTRYITRWLLEGITPACAGKSCIWRGLCTRRRDHPRMRGEK